LVELKVSNLDVFAPVGFAWEFGWEGKRGLWRVRNIEENGEIFYIFYKRVFFFF